MLSSLPSGQQPPPEDIVAFKKRAFTAVLDEEEERLKRVQPLIRTLREEVEAIG